VSSYFDYPTDDAPGSDLTFLADRAEADWTAVLDHTEVRRFSAGEEVIRAGDDDRALYLLTSGSLASTRSRRSPADTPSWRGRCCSTSGRSSRSACAS
jgi:hypothetical protein